MALSLGWAEPQRSPAGENWGKAKERSKRRVNEIKVQVLKAKIGQRLPARRNHIVLTVFVVPQLRRNPEFFPIDSVTKNLLKRRSDLRFISIHRSAIEMPIANCSCTFYCLGNLARSGK